MTSGGRGRVRSAGAWRNTVSLLAGLRTRDWLALGALSLMSAAAPIVTLFIVKFLVDHVSRLATDQVGTWAVAIVAPVAAYFLVNVIADSTETLELLQIATLRDQMSFEVDRRTITTTLSHHDLGVFDRVEVKQQLILAKEAAAAGQYLVQLVSNLSTGLLLAIPTLVIVGSLAAWIPLLVVATTIPATLVQVRYERKAWDVEKHNVDLNNRVQELRSLMLNPRYGADVRAYLMHVLLLPRWRTEGKALIGARRRIRNRGATQVMVFAVVSGLGLLVPYGYVIERAVAGELSLGTLALFIGLIPELRRSLFIVCANAGEIAGANRQLDGLWKYEAVRPGIAIDPGLPVRDDRPCASAPAVRFRGVSFRYADHGPPAVADVDIDLPVGSATLVVGENGAGKSTIAKLLCRFYDPTEGSVSVGDVDLRDADVIVHRRRTAVLVQDPARLPLSIREALAIGDPNVSEHALTEALDSVGLLAKVEGAPNGLDTELSTSLNSGMELSGGQWQRLAIARLLIQLPTATMVVVDEPTTALDPVAERALGELILQRCSGKTVLVVSHRLQFARAVTQVALMANGRLIDVAPHDDLIATNADYRRMYEAP